MIQLADELTTTLANFLYDMHGPFVENFSKQHVLSDRLKRNTNTSNFDGLQVRVPLLLSLKQGTSGIAENGTVPTPQVLNQTKATIGMARVVHPISLSPDLMKSAEGGNFAVAGGAIKLEMQQAESAMPRVENEFLNGNGDALLAAVTASTNTTAFTTTFGTAAAPTQANTYQLYPGRVGDLLVRSTGATVTNGSGRTILSVNTGTGVVTLDSGGGNANIDNTYGFYIQGSYGNAIQGIQQAQGTSGTFEGVNRSTSPQWKGIDGRNGDTTAADLSIAILDGAERQVRQSGIKPEFYIGDPAACDKFGQSLLVQSRWAGDKGELDTGWGGYMYRNTPIIPEFDHRPNRISGINTTAMTFYGYGQAPDWDKLDGSIFKRIGTRSLVVEAWLVDYVQAGFHRCNAFVYCDNLNVAA